MVDSAESTIIVSFQKVKYYLQQTRIYNIVNQCVNFI